MPHTSVPDQPFMRSSLGQPRNQALTSASIITIQMNCPSREKYIDVAASFLRVESGHQRISIDGRRDMQEEQNDSH
ncbi:hypothetical protein OSTOST_19067, partial [Ostertagia ostertagi]